MLPETQQFYEQAFQDDFDDGSDSAPEEVTFQEEEEKSRQSQKQAVEQIKAQKEVLKRKRKEIHLRNKLQKEEKKKKLEGKRLPSDVLENLRESSSETEFKSNTKLVRKVFEDTKEVEDVQPDNGFISIHGSTIFKVEVMNQKTKKSCIPESIANFRRNALQQVSRESTRSLISKMEKQKVRQQKT